MPMAELFQKKRLLDWDDEEEHKQRIEGHCIVAWWVHNTIEMDKDKHIAFVKFLQMYGVIDTPTKEQTDYDRLAAIESVHSNPMFAEIIAGIAPARRKPT